MQGEICDMKTSWLPRGREMHGSANEDDELSVRARIPVNLGNAILNLKGRFGVLRASGVRHL